MAPSSIGHPFGQGSRAPASEQLGSASAPQPLSAPLPLLSLFWLRLPLLHLQPLRLPLRRLRVLRIRLLNPPRLVGFRLVLRLLVTVVTPIHPQSRRPVRRRAMSPAETPLLLVWQTSFMRSVRTLVPCLTPRVTLAAVLSLGSASQRLQLPGSTSGSTPGSRRLLLGRRLWLASPSLSRISSPPVRVISRWRMISCSPRHSR